MVRDPYYPYCKAENILKQSFKVNYSAYRLSHLYDFIQLINFSEYPSATQSEYTY